MGTHGRRPNDSRDTTLVALECWQSGGASCTVRISVDARGGFFFQGKSRQDGGAHVYFPDAGRETMPLGDAGTCVGFLMRHLADRGCPVPLLDGIVRRVREWERRA